ncbi:hypothetical protein [Nocardioides sp. YIM 152588]|uniref:hypothetical protein n=1 Tax=Nocardioides sp. YIM 152588 TaxID=3158259 RepID=UPI0032E5244D
MLVDWQQRRLASGRTYWVPTQLWQVLPPDLFATIRVPRSSAPDGYVEWDLRDRDDRRRCYESLIVSTIPHMMVRWLDGGFLVDLWDELDLPAELRRAWEPAVERYGASTITDVMAVAEAPETAAYGSGATVRSYAPLESDQG